MLINVISEDRVNSRNGQLDFSPTPIADETTYERPKEGPELGPQHLRCILFTQTSTIASQIDSQTVQPI